MGRQGQESLAMETDGSHSSSLRRQQNGIHLSKFSAFLLVILFVASLVATGILVYYFSHQSNSNDSQEAVEYNVKQHSTGSAAEGEATDSDGDSPKKKKVRDVRLPRSIKPLHYYVRLTPFIGTNFSISGHVELTFEVVQPTKNVTLHINDILTKNETVKIVPENGGGIGPVKIQSHSFDKDRQFYVAGLTEELPNGVYVISMDYEGHLNDDLDGFYRSSYEDENKNKKWLAATQFQATDARKAFPCMDEPGLKASFTIEIGRQSNMTSLTNMPLKNTVPMKGHPGWFWDKFEKSVKMSTYLVAFIVSDFDYLESSEPTNYKFKVWARKEAISQADYAIKIGPPTSKYFEEFFNVSFPLPKQDMVALPDFSAGAMENWGLITYRETAMLYDPTSSRAADKQYLAAVIAHELAHQWFGNLVTPEWWTDLWLNEGFASYMEYIGASHVEPSWKMMEMFVTLDLQSVFSLDCLESSHPINIPVHHPDEIGEIFDKISYLKGSSIIRMMSNFLTENTFRRGLSKYLKGLAYKSAVQDDLWRYLTEQGHEDGTLAKDMTVKTIMDTWTLQMGFPVVTVMKQDGDKVLLKQERFLLIGNKTSNSDHDYKWWIPITFTTQNNPDFSKTNPDIWMSPSETTKVIDNVQSNNGWIIFNNLQTGYYRVNYEEKNWQLIAEQLQRDHAVISTINRAQIIDDSMDLARAGLLSYETAFKILSYLKNEREFVPWMSALSSLSFIQTMFSHKGGYGALKEFILSLILPVYNEIGFSDRVTDPHLEQLLRESILAKACDLGHKPCVDEALKLFKLWKQNPENNSIISPNLKKFVYCTAISDGSFEDWTFAWDQYRKSNIGAEKRTILGALGCTKQPWVAYRYIYRSIRAGDGIRKQDAGTVIGAVASTEIGRLIAWDFIKDKWTSVQKYFGSVSFTLARILKSTTYALNTENNLKELNAFSLANRGNFGTAERAMKQAIEKTQNNLDWMNRNYEIIFNWLARNNYTDKV